VAEGPVRVPIDALHAGQRERLRVLAAGASLELRWDGDAAIVVAADDEAQARLLVAAAAGARPDPGIATAPVATTTSGARRAAAAEQPAEPAYRLPDAMWAVDPTGRHEYRYWSGAVWTAHVADHGRQSADPLVEPPPPGPVIPPPPAAQPGTFAGAGPVSPTTPTDPTRVLGRRYGAFFIDVAITFAVFMLAFIPLATRRTVAETLRLPDCSRSSLDSSQVQCDDRFVIQVNDVVYEADVLPTAGITFAFVFLYFGILEGVTGATLGKRAAGIRVVQPDGSNVGVGRQLARWIVFAVDGPLSLFLCGIITTATSRGHRRLGDMAGGTYVVSREAVGHTIELD
jgi:uncharacterized RDD family membrane protein YckC